MNNEKYEKLHLQLQDLLAGYADNMLDLKEKDIVDAHLAGCKACRMDVARQQLLSHRLNEIPTTLMSPELHQRLDFALNNAHTLEDHTAPKVTGWRTLWRQNWLENLPKFSFASSSGWVVAMVLLMVMLTPDMKFLHNKEIPMVQNVIAEYLTLNKIALPVSDQNAQIKPPVSWPGARVLASWKTTVGGSPAEAFAVRNGDNIVIQFRIDEAVFFHNPEVRLSVANTGSYKIQQRNLEVLAIPLKNAGLLIVGPKNGIPTPNTET